MTPPEPHTAPNGPDPAPEVPPAGQDRYRPSDGWVAQLGRYRDEMAQRAQDCDPADLAWVTLVADRAQQRYDLAVAEAAGEPPAPIDPKRRPVYGPYGTCTHPSCKRRGLDPVLIDDYTTGTGIHPSCAVERDAADAARDSIKARRKEAS